MAVFLILLLAIILIDAEFAPKGEFCRDYLSRKTTLAVKGVFVIMIVFSHYSQYYELEGPWDQAYLTLKNHLNQMVVSMFLFYSGYGIMEAYRKKGGQYIKEFPVKRFLIVFLNFSIAIVLYLIMDMVLHIEYSPRTILLSFTGWTTVGNSNWYMFVVFGVYLITWISFTVLGKLGKNKAQWLGAVLTTILSMGLVFFQMKMERPFYCYSTLILYSAGMWYSLLREKIEAVVLKTSLLYALSCMICGGIYVYSFRFRYRSIEKYSIWAIAFTAAILLFTMKVKIGNPVLEWFGEHVFSIYILQRIPMKLFTEYNLFGAKKYTALVCVFLVLIPMAMIFDDLTGRMNRKVRQLFVK